jgi:hypothetical protein
VLLGSLALAAANKDTINQDVSQVCAGMYGKSTWGGARSPVVVTQLKSFHAEGNHKDTDHNDDDINVSLVVFEYKDVELLGAQLADGNKKYICDQSSVDKGICDESQLGSFIFNKENHGKNESQVLLYSIKSKEDADKLKYNIAHTGYYCIATYTANRRARYNIEVNFKNSFGEIAASEYPKIPLYALLAILYAISLAYYGWNFYKHKHEILPLQKNLLFFFIFLTIETLLTFTYFDLENAKGSSNGGVKAYMALISILNGFKFTFSFYLLLIIALGYGIVHPKLDRKVLLKCKILAGVHFTFAVAYIITSYLSSPENEADASGLFVLPVMITTVIFYVTVLKSLSQTTHLLNEQKQVVKLQMFNKLFKIIFFSLLVLILGVFVSSFIFLGMSTIELIEQHWKTRFFFLEFWPSLVYFTIFNMVAFIWRPTDTSYMLAASSQLPTDPENAADFELDDLQSMVNTEGDEYQNIGDNDSLDLNDDDDDGDLRDTRIRASEEEGDEDDAKKKYSKGKKD